MNDPTRSLRVCIYLTAGILSLSFEHWIAGILLVWFAYLEAIGVKV